MATLLQPPCRIAHLEGATPEAEPARNPRAMNRGDLSLRFMGRPIPGASRPGWRRPSGDDAVGPGGPRGSIPPTADDQAESPSASDTSGFPSSFIAERIR